jgi:hypothetical protein
LRDFLPAAAWYLIRVLARRSAYAHLRARTRRPFWVVAAIISLLSGLLSACAPAASTPTPPPAPPPTVSPPSTPQPAPTTAPSVSTPAAGTLRAPARVAPLSPFPISIALPGSNEPAELVLFDSRERPVGRFPVTLRDGAATVTVTTRGALGPQRADLVVGGRVLAETPRLFTLDAQTTVQTGQPRFDALYTRLRGFMDGAVVVYRLNDTPVRGYRSPDNNLLWLRDHVYQHRGFRYFERDVTSLLDAFRRAQRPDGSLPDWLDRPDFGVRAGRKAVEADVEFLYVQGVYEAWQSTGDHTWLRQHIEPMRRAVAYSTSDPLRWDAERQLVKRPYTIDMWDFSYGPTTVSPETGKLAPRHWIDDQTIWGIFHGDNTGLAHALELLARMEERVGEPARAVGWRDQAAGILDRLRKLSWNGRFYTHFVPLTPFSPPGVDTSEQLSVSNTYALNRIGVGSRRSRAIVEEYFRRFQRGGAFAEWYSIDPPFPAGSFGMAGGKGEQPGEYVNGGILPLAGGELARGAFRSGAETYGFDILARYDFLTSQTGATYLWYYPQGNPGKSGPDTIPTDGWGAGAMLGGLIEGAAGVTDEDNRYRAVTISPRWAAAPDVNSATVVARYGASDGYVAYRWERLPRGLRLTLAGSGERAMVRLLLPEDAPTPTTLTSAGVSAPIAIDEVFGSRYVTLETDLAAVIVLGW